MQQYKNEAKSNKAYLVLNIYPNKKLMEVEVIQPKINMRLSQKKSVVLTKKHELLIVDKWKLMNKENYDTEAMMVGEERKEVIVDELYKNLIFDKGISPYPAQDDREFTHKDQLID